MEIMSFLHVKLDVRDLDRSVAFYCGELNMREICRYPIPNGVLLQLSPNGLPPGIELWYEEPKRPIPDTQMHIAFQVDDVRQWVQYLRSKGTKIEREPFEIGHEVIAFVRDPDGYLVELIQVVRQEN